MEIPLIPLVWRIEMMVVEEEGDHNPSARPRSDKDRLIIHISVTLSGKLQVNFIASE